MKRRLLTFIVWLFSMAAFAQQGDVMLCEGFYTPWLEEGWDAKGDDWVVWYVSNTTFAGGKSHEMQMYPDFNFEGTTRLVTPIVNLNKYDFINFQFNHALEATQGKIDARIGIGISQNGEDWESIWEDTIVGSIAQYFTGHGAYVNSWYIDNIFIFASKKNKYGGIDDTDENGFIASASHVTTLKGPSAGTVTHFSKMRKSRNRYARVVEGRQKRWWQFWK